MRKKITKRKREQKLKIRAALKKNIRNLQSSLERIRKRRIVMMNQRKKRRNLKRREHKRANRKIVIQTQ